MMSIEKEEQPNADHADNDPWDKWEEEPPYPHDDPKPPRWWAGLAYLPDALFIAMWVVGFASGYQWARLWP